MHQALGQGRSLLAEDKEPPALRIATPRTACSTRQSAPSKPQEMSLTTSLVPCCGPWPYCPRGTIWPPLRLPEPSYSPWLGGHFGRCHTFPGPFPVIGCALYRNRKLEQVLTTCCGFSEPSMGSENLAVVLRTLVGFSELWVLQNVWQGRYF